MTKYENLKNDMTIALKSGNKLKRLVLGDMVAAVDKAATQGKTRVEITDQLVDEVLAKYNKMIAETYASIPDTPQYADRKEECRIKMEYVDTYAPRVISNPDEIRELISEHLGAGRKFSNMGEGMRFIKASGCDARAAQPIVKEFI